MSDKVCGRVEPVQTAGQWSRRDLLFGVSKGLGGIALSALLHQHAAQGAELLNDPLAPKRPHFAAKAKSCIFLFMYGGPSQIDTFDPKPLLNRYHGTPVTRIQNNRMEERLYVGSTF